MSLRSNGSYIGPRPTGPVGAYNGAASGIWDLRTAQRQQAAGTWPIAEFTPDVLTGLQLWLDASDASTLYDATSGGSLVAADGGVARWEDKSGNARHATQGTSANRPARKTAIQGGKDVLRFDGSNDSLSIPSSTATFKFLHTSNATVFVAFKPSGANPDELYMLIDNCRAGGQTGYTLFYDDRTVESRNDKILSAGGVGAASYLVVSANDFSPANAFSCITNVIKAADGTAGNRSRLYRNGVIDAAVNTASGSTSSDASNNLQIGEAHTGSTFFYRLNGDIAEIIIYNSALSDTDREAVENYLLAKWAIT